MSIEPRNTQGLGSSMANATMLQMSNSEIAGWAAARKPARVGGLFSDRAPISIQL